MICIKANIPEELNEIDDELKAVYHSKDTVCFFILKTRELRNKFIEETKGMNKSEREKVYEVYNSKPTEYKSVTAIDAYCIEFESFPIPGLNKTGV